MRRRLLLFTLAVLPLLALSAGMQVGRTTAQTNSYGTLAGYLLNNDDLAGTGFRVAGADQRSTDSDGTLSVIRSFRQATDGGPAVLVLALYGAPDGSPPPTSITNLVASGALLQAVASNLGTSVDSFTLGGSQGIGDLDQGATFSGSYQGSTYNWAGDSFVNKNLVGLVLYGAPSGYADGSLMDTILAAQDDKLP